MMDYVVISFWAFLAWYLPKLEAGQNHEGSIEGSDNTSVKNLDQVYFQLGLVHESMMQYMRAVVNYKEAVRINPRFEKAHFGIGKNYILAKRYEKAVQPLERAYKLNPEETLTSIYLGWVNNQLGNHGKAAEILKKVLNYSALCPSCGIRHHKNAALAASAVIQIPSGKQGNEPGKNGDGQAVQPAHPAPVSFGNATEKAALLSTQPANDKNGDDKEDPSTTETQELKIEFDGQNLIDARLAVTLYRYGLAHIKMEEYFPAMVELSEAVRLDPEFSDAHYALGLAYERMGMHKESVAEYILALKDKPEYHEAKFKLEEEVTLDELKRLLPGHFAQEETRASTHHHHAPPAKVVPLKRPPKSFRETVKEEGWGGAIRKGMKRFY